MTNIAGTGDLEQKALELLPWYVNGTLKARSASSSRGRCWQASPAGRSSSACAACIS